jgi:archaetidylinositol phosphate synthase
MALNRYRGETDPFLLPLARGFGNVDPNTLTWIGLLFAVLAGIGLYLSYIWLLPIATLLIFLSSLFDALDGKVAKLTGKVTKKGDFLDHVFDRFGDVFILGGITLGQYCDQTIGLMAIIGILLTSYVGTQGQAVGVGRIYKGILGRAERLVLLIIIPLIQYVVIYFHGRSIWLFTPFEYLMIFFAVAGFITVIQRCIIIWNGLGKKGLQNH